MTTDEAKKEYLDNLQRRADGQSFQGLPTWHIEALRDCKDILDDHLCDEVGIPRGSTIGISVVFGKHWMYLDVEQWSKEAISLDRIDKYVAGYIAGMMYRYGSTNVAEFMSKTINNGSSTVRQHVWDVIEDKVREVLPSCEGNAFDAQCAKIMEEVLTLTPCLVGGVGPAPNSLKA